MAARHARTEGAERPLNPKAKREGAQPTKKTCGGTPRRRITAIRLLAGSARLTDRRRFPVGAALTVAPCIRHIQTKGPPQPGRPLFTDHGRDQPFFRQRLPSTSAICTAFSAAPLRRLSDTHHRFSPFSIVLSCRMRLI